MEALLQQSRSLCPFLSKTSPSTLRSLSTSTRPHASSPGGGTISNLQVIAKRCPVMSKALAVQSSRMAAGCPIKGLGAAMRVSVHGKRAMHTSAVRHANVRDEVNKKAQRVPPVLLSNKPSDALKRDTVCPGPKPAVPPAGKFNYEAFYAAELEKKHKDKTYRYFNNINRLAREFPKAHMATSGDRVTVWCANDYLGMGRNPYVLRTMHETLDNYGAGAGGTRNISGHNQHAVALEDALARLHRKESALVFSSCYVANDATLATLGSKLPDCVILSDSLNHASMIQGIRHSGAKKMVFKHNDLQDLENKLASLPPSTPKIIAFESVYSMCGSIAPIEEICDLAEKYAYGCVGGYIAGSARFVDTIRSLAPGFIFTTSLPPATMAGAATSIKYQAGYGRDRTLQQLHTRAVKAELNASDIPVIPNPSHIIPILVGDAEVAKRASDMLLEDYGIYVQAINYPTVPRGEERLRVTPTPGHIKPLRDHLVASLKQVWERLGIRKTSDWKKVGGFLGVGDEAAVKDAKNQPMWTDEQLGLAQGEDVEAALRRELQAETIDKQHMLNELAEPVGMSTPVAPAVKVTA
ncbi:5-aminolevulinate synthase [Coccidioides immitis RMSCC 3703]|uniref:5-aminolevulinate synthase n=1 Tax=Coccidioides immitis RMSCC 3703 TaxID=454286 RepID=A0A0J8QUS3_COCIT|nr:5-aminolevulinate synthase [Coccidioides immitis RMSCC 3703]